MSNFAKGGYEVFEVFDELMENIRNVKDIVEDSEEVAYEIQGVPEETIMLTDVVNQKIHTLEHKAQKVGKVINKMLSSIDEGNMILDETMEEIKKSNLVDLVDRKEIDANLNNISRKIQKVERYSNQI
ncbi:MAG: hypothetical protein E7262_05430 [Lachnospiraceae bacterium]|nr:hypothetical protein [Lachnospiraceae bacterium]